MNKDLWAKVKSGDVVIYADEYSGVFRATIIEVDISIQSATGPAFREQPYGLTKDTGTVKIKYDSQELIANLEQLIKHSVQRLERLQRAWNHYQTAKAAADDLLTAFKEVVTRETAF